GQKQDGERHDGERDSDVASMALPKALRFHPFLHEILPPGGVESCRVCSICGHEDEAEFASALLGVRRWLSSVMREAISLLSVARSLLNAADSLTPSGPAGDPTVVCDA